MGHHLALFFSGVHVKDTAVTAVPVEGIADIWGYVQKFREFQGKFTDADGITLADVIELGTYLAGLFGAGEEGKAIAELIASFKGGSAKDILYGISALSKLIADRISTIVPTNGDADNPFGTIPVSAGPDMPSELSQLCGQLADKLEETKPAVMASADGVAAPAPKVVPPIILWIGGMIIKSLIEKFMKR